MDKLTEMIKEIYKVNIDACRQEVAIAEKYNDQDFMNRAKKNLKEWQEKLDEAERGEI